MGNHLGNVRVVVSDRKELDTESGTLSADVVSYSNYYPFGAPMPGRNFNGPEYRYGFQGQEKDGELKGEGLSVNYKYRMHDPRIGRFFAVDPLAAEYPHNAPYAFSENRVIDAIELEGLEKFVITTPNSKRNKVQIRVQPASELKKDVTTVATSLMYLMVAPKIGKFNPGSTNISSISSRIARHLADDGDNFTKDEGSERNAFRHALWSAKITSDFGIDSALDLTNSHEGIGAGQMAEIDFTLPIIQNKEGMDQMVDFLNNEIGREIASKLEKSSSQKDLAKAVLNVFKEEGLWRFVGGNGNQNIERVKINQKQFDFAINKLDELDESGFSEADKKQMEND